jgi:hypothetical protein
MGAGGRILIDGGSLDSRRIPLLFSVNALIGTEYHRTLARVNEIGCSISYK